MIKIEELFEARMAKEGLANRILNIDMVTKLNRVVAHVSILLF